jgi:hypothetical protein
MSALTLTPETRITRDARADAARTVFVPRIAPVGAPAHPMDARGIARQALDDHRDLFAFDTHTDVREGATLAGENAYSVRFVQHHHGVPVDAAEVVVNLHADGTVYSVYNNYKYEIPDGLDPDRATVGAETAAAAVDDLLRGYERVSLHDPRLIVAQLRPEWNRPPKPLRRPAPERAILLAEVEKQRATTGAGAVPAWGEYRLAWEVVADARPPRGMWRFLVDAYTGQVLQVFDLLQYASGSAQVFDPNPTVTSGNLLLAGSSPIATIDAERTAVTVPRLNVAVAGKLHLDGLYVHMDELEAPSYGEPANAAGNFQFSFSDRGFLDAMTYFHIDRFQDYIQTVLSLSSQANFSIAVDPQGLSGADNSHYVPGSHFVAFGEGGVPDASDAMVVLHEYGHALQDNVNPGFNNPPSGVGEGFGDFLAAVYYDDKHANPANTRGKMMCWDAAPFGSGSWAGRRYDVAWLFDGPEYTGSTENHHNGQLWCATMFELYRKLGGDSGYPDVKARARDLAIRLHLAANPLVPTANATAAQMGQQVEACDANLAGWRYPNGLHRKVIYDTFRRRHLAGYTSPTVDVYVNDGREGGYGSASGNDLFSETLWQEVFWETQDIWTRPTPYGNAAAQAAGGPADHVEPTVNATAHLYVRVKNRGTGAGGSGAVTVRAFHCAPGMGLTWPEDWVPMDIPSITVPNVLPGAANSVVVGPFDWVPTEVGHECTLVVLECAQDHALTQSLLVTDHVEHSDLVPFDNNIAQRNLAPVSAKGKTMTGFYVRNPLAESAVIALHYEDELPRGWRWQTEAEPEFRLQPRERRWVDLTIDQAGGSPVVAFDRVQRLRISATASGRPIGGMTFYVAPPSAFSATPGDGGTGDGHIVGEGATHHHGDRGAGSLLGVELRWSLLNLKGDIGFRLRLDHND